MTTKATIQEICPFTNTKNGVEFPVNYINTTDGRSFTVYPNTTKNVNLLEVGKELTFHYKVNSKNGKTYFNCYNITPSEQLSPSKQIIELLTNINETLELLVQQKQSAPPQIILKDFVREPLKPINDDYDSDDLPF